MFWLRGATHHAVSLRSLAPRLRAHVPAQCRTLLRCTDVRGFTTTLRNRNWAVWQKKSSALSTSDKLSRLPQRTIGTLWNSLAFSHVSLIRYLMHLDAGHKPSILFAVLHGNCGPAAAQCPAQRCSLGSACAHIQ